MLSRTHWTNITGWIKAVACTRTWPILWDYNFAASGQTFFVRRDLWVQTWGYSRWGIKDSSMRKVPDVLHSSILYKLVKDHPWRKSHLNVITTLYDGVHSEDRVEWATLFDIQLSPSIILMLLWCNRSFWPGKSRLRTFCITRILWSQLVKKTSSQRFAHVWVLIYGYHIRVDEDCGKAPTADILKAFLTSVTEPFSLLQRIWSKFFDCCEAQRFRVLSFVELRLSPTV